MHKKNAISNQFNTIGQNSTSSKKGAVVVDHAISNTYIQPPSRFVWTGAARSAHPTSREEAAISDQNG